MDHPDNFLNIIFHKASSLGDDLGLCAGFEENGEMISFADHVMKWLPEFALNHSELNEIGHHNAMRMTKKSSANCLQYDEIWLTR